MPMFKSINEGVNLLSGREREEYAGWKPRRRESVRDFDARIKALPIFTQLGLVDGGVDVIKGGDTSTLDPDLIMSHESPVTDANTREVLARQEFYDEHGGDSKKVKFTFH